GVTGGSPGAVATTGSGGGAADGRVMSHVAAAAHPTNRATDPPTAHPDRRPSPARGVSSGTANTGEAANDMPQRHWSLCPSSASSHWRWTPQAGQAMVRVGMAEPTLPGGAIRGTGARRVVPDNCTLKNASW